MNTRMAAYWKYFEWSRGMVSVTVMCMVLGVHIEYISKLDWIQRRKIRNISNGRQAAGPSDRTTQYGQDGSAMHSQLKNILEWTTEPQRLPAPPTV
jgi:hypothetical protein